MLSRPTVGVHLEYRGYGTQIQYTQANNKYVGAVSYLGLSMLINGEMFPIVCSNIEHFEEKFHAVVDDFLESNADI